MNNLIKSGDIYDQLTVIKEDTTRKKYWICKCSCGNISSYAQTSLRNGRAHRCKVCGYKAREENKHKNEYEELLKKPFNFLTVLEKDENSGGSGHAILWKCQCKCGNLIKVSTSDLLKGSLNKTCGDSKCYYRNKNISINSTINLIGKKFFDLEVIDRDKKKELITTGRGSYWKCKCKCGNIITASRTSLINGTCQRCLDCSDHTKSIGEYNIENILKHNNILYQKEISFSNLVGVNGGKLRFDFGIYEKNTLKRLIEFDGEFHYLDKDIWNSKLTQKNDKIKNKWCKENNIPLVRIPYWERDNITLNMILGDKYLWEDQEK